MLIKTINQEDNKEDNKEENKEENKEDNKEENKNITIINQPILNTQIPVKKYLDTNTEMKHDNNYFINSIKNNIKYNNTKNKSINTNTNINTKEKKCWCYNKESQDMRCCGLCYTFCYNPNKVDQCYFCPETFEIYYTSGYVITNDGLSHTGEECEDCLCTTICLPTKIVLFWPCFFGSIFNNSINYCRDTNTNYLC